ncbi:UDPGP type 1 family protein [Paenibacillus sp. MAHUQ-46]|uniref:UDPGP type 1 family protein n=2 Tax=Paenibacillus TaxID=44249 RepID=A0A934IZW6_9BACL|nr:UDPGP type 1 family protein [Paenibacillus roseus]
MQLQAVIALLKIWRQEHLLEHYDTLPEVRKQELLEQILALDFEWLRHLHMNNEKDTGLQVSGLAPLSVQSLDDLKTDRGNIEQTGWDLLREGKVAALLVAGGQGSRLGYNGPKGTLDIGLPSRKSLFQLQAERLLNLGRRAGTTIPWCIMTSPGNHKATFDFFAQHQYFGYDKEQLFFFNQAVIPALDHKGKIILETPWRICSVPNGTGGCISAMRSSGILDQLKARGVEWFFYYNVDNALIKVADPHFIGFAHTSGQPIACKVIAKRDADEKIGVVCLQDGRPSVVEYSDFPEQLKRQRDIKTGRLLYDTGNISIHMFQLQFLEKASRQQLVYKAVQKDVQTFQGPVRAYKYEAFIFDLFAYASGMSLVKVEREEEFAPVKNAAGPDSPEEARRLLLHVHQTWFEKLGVSEDLFKGREIEVSPLISYDGEGLAVDMLCNKDHPSFIYIG